MLEGGGEKVGRRGRRGRRSDLVRGEGGGRRVEKERERGRGATCRGFEDTVRASVGILPCYPTDPLL